MIEANEGFPPELLSDDHNRSRSREYWESDRQEVEEVPAYYSRRSAGVWTCLAALSVALGVAVAYGYAVLSQEGIQLEQIPGLTRSLPAISQHLASFEKRLTDSRAAQQSLATQMQNIDVDSKAALSQTRQQTGRLMAQVEQTFDKRLSQQTAAFQAQVSLLASDRTKERVLLTQVQGQLAQEQNAIMAVRADYSRDLAAVREQQGVQHTELASISSSLPTHHVTFDVQRNQRVEIAPGVSFQLTKADVGRQRFDGWIESAPGHQRVSVQGQGLRTPIVFFPSEDSKALMLVVTRISQMGVTGYLLIPTGSHTTDQAHMVSAADNPLGTAPTSSAGKSILAEP